MTDQSTKPPGPAGTPPDLEARARAIHETRGGCPICVLGSIPNTPSWRELFEESRERHRAAARNVQASPAGTPPRQHREADIVINGVRLTMAQSMAVRVAVANFLMELASDERQDDLEGQTYMEALGPIGPAYQARLSEVQNIIIDPLVRG